MNKQTLIQKIKSISDLTHEEQAELINLVNNTKKYGLVWEDKFEQIEEDLLTNLPVLSEVKERFIEATSRSGKYFPGENKNLNLSSRFFAKKQRPYCFTTLERAKAIDRGI